jgi:Pentapeptide repeats (8 copies)
MKLKKLAVIGIRIIALVVFVFWLYLMVTSWSSYLLWTGFVEYTTKIIVERANKDPQSIVTKFTEEKQAGKTFWDWLQLAGIPVVLAYGGYLLNQREQKRNEKREEAAKKRAAENLKAEQDRAAENLREEALQTYFDRISELLLEHNLGEPHHLFPVPGQNPDQNNNPARDIARARTLTVLRRLDNDGQRKAAIVTFLHEAELIKEEIPIINLNKANLNGSKLSGANLSFANLEGADISKAELGFANLGRAQLRRANLEGTDLTFADLRGAILYQADLSGASLYGADVKGADIVGAILYQADLSRAENLIEKQLDQAKLCKTTLPDGKVNNRDCEELKWKWGRESS